MFVYYIRSVPVPFRNRKFLFLSFYYPYQRASYVITEMGTRSRSFIDGNYNQDSVENKENTSNIAIVTDNQIKYSQKCLEKRVNKFTSAKSLMNMKPKKLSKSAEEKKLKAKSSGKDLKKQIISNQCDNSYDVSKTLMNAEKVRRPLVTSDLTQNVKSDLERQDLSEVQNNQSVNPLKMKEAVVVLKRYTDILKETGHEKSYDYSDIEAKEVTVKSDSSLPECECHSAFSMKDAVVVLERYEDIQKDAAIVKLCDHSNVVHKDDGNAKKAAGRSTKRKREENVKNENEASSKTTKSKKQKDSAQSKNSKKDDIPDVSALDFNNDSKSSSGNLWNFKISSWNVNGIRAWLEKNGLSYLRHEQPDILCIQETKCSDDKLPDEVKNIEGYHVYWLSGDKEGYSGVGLITKEKPIKVEYGIGISEHDNEGRVITAEYEKFYLVSSYVPNAGRGLVRLNYRMQWDKDFRDYLKKLDSEKPVILCGDLNVAHEEIDLANPKTNKKNAGFTKEEREGFSTLLKEGFIDSFRHLYPDVKGAYTFWTYMMNARAKNVGWRLDYFVMSERFTDNLCDNVIRKDVFGSDHCPITLFLSL